MVDEAAVKVVDHCVPAQLSKQEQARIKEEWRKLEHGRSVLQLAKSYRYYLSSIEDMPLDDETRELVAKIESKNAHARTFTEHSVEDDPCITAVTGVTRAIGMVF